MIAIDEIQIQGFTSLRDIHLKLEPLTALIGNNDTGKTNIMKAFKLLSLLTRGAVGVAFDSFGGWNRCVFQGNIEGEIMMTTTGRVAHSSWSGPFRHGICLALSSDRNTPQVSWEYFHLEGLAILRDRANDEITGKQAPLIERTDRNTAFSMLAQPFVIRPERQDILPLVTEIRKGFQQMEIYRLRPENLALPAPPAHQPVLAPDGSNIAAAIDALATDPIHRPVFQRIQASLSQMVPYITDIGTRLLESRAEKIISFVSTFGDRRYSFDANQASDGLLLLLAFLLMCDGPQPAPVLLLEEPENGVHVGRLAEIIRLLRQVVAPEKNNRKVLMATHSPYLLDYLNQNEVQIVTRDDSGATYITPMANYTEIDSWLKGFRLGEIWTNVGESGLVEGVQK